MPFALRGEYVSHMGLCAVSKYFILDDQTHGLKGLSLKNEERKSETNQK